MTIRLRVSLALLSPGRLGRGQRNDRVSSLLNKCGTGILPVILLVLPPLTGDAARVHRLEAGATQENQVLQQAVRRMIWRQWLTSVRGDGGSKNKRGSELAVTRTPQARLSALTGEDPQPHAVYRRRQGAP